MIRKNLSGMRAHATLIAGAALALAFFSLLVFAYTPEQDDVNNAPVPTRWVGNVTWRLNPTIKMNVHTTGGDDVGTAVGKAFTTWLGAQLNGQPVAQLSVTRGTDTTLTNTDPMNASDCINIVSFVDTSSSDFPASTGTIAFAAVTTSYGVAPNNYTCTPPPPVPPTCGSVTSCIIDVDIMFSPTQQFSTTTPPLANNFDVQSVATHEIGHMLGLDHSGIAAAVMYPFGDTGQSEQRTLAVDDAVGIGFIYPSANFNSSTGIISGQVTQGGSGIFASHVVAIDTATGDAVIDGLTDPQGNYKLVGVPPGTYNVLALPLAPDANSGFYTLSDFGGWACGYAGTAENSPPCCDPTLNPTTCTGKALSNPTNYTGKFY